MLKEVLPGYWMVKTPKGAYQFGIYWEGTSVYWLVQRDNKVLEEWQDIPEGQWEIVGVVSEIPEEVAKGIVEWQFDTCRDYEDTDDMDNLSCYTLVSPTESLLSLARSHGFEPDQSILLNKKV